MFLPCVSMTSQESFSQNLQPALPRDIPLRARISLLLHPSEVSQASPIPHNPVVLASGC